MIIRIPIALFTAWFLSLFGFDGVVQQGMFELFKLDISTTGYYFIFGAIAMIKTFFIRYTPTTTTKQQGVKNDLQESGR